VDALSASTLFWVKRLKSILGLVMIIKELDRIETIDKFEQAGYRAESQLAFYRLCSQLFLQM
jgi:hypothetical protein